MCQIERLEETGEDKYVLVVRPLEPLDIELSRTKEGSLIFNVEHSSSPELPSGNKSVSHAAFVAAIENLKAAFGASQVTRFGYMGSAYRSVPSKPGHYRVYGLRIDEELTDSHTGTRNTVYAY